MIGLYRYTYTAQSSNRVSGSSVGRQRVEFQRFRQSIVMSVTIQDVYRSATLSSVYISPKKDMRIGDDGKRIVSPETNLGNRFGSGQQAFSSLFALWRRLTLTVDFGPSPSDVCTLLRLLVIMSSICQCPSILLHATRSSHASNEVCLGSR